MPEVEQREVVDEQVDTTESENEKTPTQLLEEATALLASTQAELDRAKAEAREHEKNVTRKANEVKTLKQSGERIGALEKKIETVVAMMADVLDRESYEGEEEKPKTRKSEQYLSRLREEDNNRQREQIQAQQQDVNSTATEIVKLLEPRGLTFDK